MVRRLMLTKTPLLRKAIRPRTAMLVLTTALVVAVLIECGAYELGVRAEAKATAHKDLPANYCVSCHSDPKMLRLMLEKDDNNGTAAYCAGVKLPSQQEVNANLAKRLAAQQAARSGRTKQVAEPGKWGPK